MGMPPVFYEHAIEKEICVYTNQFFDQNFIPCKHNFKYPSEYLHISHCSMLENRLRFRDRLEFTYIKNNVPHSLTGPASFAVDTGTLRVKNTGSFNYMQNGKSFNYFEDDKHESKWDFTTPDHYGVLVKKVPLVPGSLISVKQYNFLLVNTSFFAGKIPLYTFLEGKRGKKFSYLYNPYSYEKKLNDFEINCCNSFLGYLKDYYSGITIQK